MRIRVPVKFNHAIVFFFFTAQVKFEANPRPLSLPACLPSPVPPCAPSLPPSRLTDALFTSCSLPPLRLPAGTPGYFLSTHWARCHSCQGASADAACSQLCGEHAAFSAHGPCCSSRKSVRNLSGGRLLFPVYSVTFFISELLKLRKWSRLHRDIQCGLPLDRDTSNINFFFFLTENIFFVFRPIFTCGGNITGESGVIGSQGYPGVYPPNTKCVWRITVS